MSVSYYYVMTSHLGEAEVLSLRNPDYGTSQVYQYCILLNYVQHVHYVYLYTNGKTKKQTIGRNRD